ncbi:hypothetical protein I8752_27400 [Nostocaceae cyanobacterium CENA369]|uniref:Uncharacterized protein n=1 Tax=Dendronalium phyllosphericum CENA369 TaxID=1725256 RepID=A0A8J7LIB7_9NOST|nr:hypothetical protein [Dendronalium phyllosphericum]MBH8576649.1 hypothetical protein [Dendronalium phyllosphericum CENA369]
METADESRQHNRSDRYPAVQSLRDSYLRLQLRLLLVAIAFLDVVF